MLRADEVPVNAVKFCNNCKHKLPRGKCTAFPDGIPFDVLVGTISHNKPISGDNGIVFEPIAS